MRLQLGKSGAVRAEKTLSTIRACREGSGPVASDPCAGGEGLLLPCVVTLALEEDGAATLVLMQ